MTAADDLDRAVRAFRRMAVACGESSPTLITWVVCTLRVADPAVNWPPEEAQQPAVVVAGKGSFVGFRRPPRGRSPMGQYLRVNVRRADGSVVGYSLSEEAPDLTALGVVHRA